jgi:hypothetical protein
MDVLAFLIMVLLFLAMGRLVLAALAIQKNTREVADHLNGELSHALQVGRTSFRRQEPK